MFIVMQFRLFSIILQAWNMFLLCVMDVPGYVEAAGCESRKQEGGTMCPTKTPLQQMSSLTIRDQVATRLEYSYAQMAQCPWIAL